jgi:predicted AlkP superfamily pyrophosphatase or phosphodiesterase
MIVEIDGLSYWHLRKALDDGLMPTLQTMINEDGYQLSRVDCGLPSMTSACQAGIMFGDNHDIPAYRWYDKAKQKLDCTGYGLA